VKQIILNVAILSTLMAPNYADAGKESRLSQLHRERAAAHEHRSGGGPNILLKAAVLFALIQTAFGQIECFNDDPTAINHPACIGRDGGHFFLIIDSPPPSPPPIGPSQQMDPSDPCCNPNPQDWGWCMPGCRH